MDMLLYIGDSKGAVDTRNTPNTLRAGPCQFHQDAQMYAILSGKLLRYLTLFDITSIYYFDLL